MNMKSFTIGTILAVVIVSLSFNFVNDISSGTGHEISNIVNMSFEPIQTKSQEVLEKINQTSTSGIVSISGAYAMLTMPISIISLILEMTYLSFGIFTSLMSQITGLPTIFISGVLVIFAVWIAWEIIRLMWGRS